MASKKVVNKKIFSIILLNYNNEEFIEESIKSIFLQNYDNIELIITDDNSKKFQRNQIEKLINQNINKNIKKVKFLINDKNIGTVKTINKALDMVTGEYILIFASDDKLADEYVVSNYIRIFDEKNVNVITSNWIICDEKLNKIDCFQSPKYLSKFNYKKVKKLYSKLCDSNIFGAGSTCYRKIVFDKHGYFDEKFKYLEDWPYWLKLTKNNERIYYANFDGLLHRAGGISHNENFTDQKKEYINEVLCIYKDYVLNGMDEINGFKKVKILKTYVDSINIFKKYIDVQVYRDSIINYLENNSVLFYLFLDFINPKILDKIVFLFKQNLVVPLTFIFTYIVMVLIINLLDINIKINFLILIIILNYIIIFYLLSILLRFIRAKGDE